MLTDHDHGIFVFSLIHSAIGWYKTAMIRAVINIFSKSENLINNAIIAANISSTTMILVGVLHFGEEEDSFFVMIQFIANSYQIYYNFDERIKSFLMLYKASFCEYLRSFLYESRYVCLKINHYIYALLLLFSKTSFRLYKFMGKPQG